MAMASRIDNAIVWDNHVCLPMRTDAKFLPELERHRASGIDVVSVNIGFADMPWSQHLRIVSYMRRWFSRHADKFALVSKGVDIRRAKAEGRLAIVFDVEGMHPVLDDPDRVQTLYALGVRWMLVAYNRNNAAGGGCLDQDKGLTALGRRIIDRMDAAGMVLCLSHTGERTALEALEYGRHPGILSHSNPFSDTPHPRNISDALMRACAGKGGVIGLSGIGPFLGATTDLVIHLVRQVQYIADLVGAEHVGLGLDYVFDRSQLEQNVKANPARYPMGISGGISMLGPEAFPQIAALLADRGFNDAAISGIMGENWLRIANAVWR